MSMHTHMAEVEFTVTQEVESEGHYACILRFWWRFTSSSESKYTQNPDSCRTELEPLPFNGIGFTI